MMNFVVYILTYPLLWLLSLLPLRLLYFFSDFFFLIIFYVIKYRRKVVQNNLKLSFPNKNNEELAQIEQKFFRHFTDIFIEMIKSFSISRSVITKRYQYENLELLDKLSKDGKNLIIMVSHHANWEWLVGIHNLVPYKGYAAFARINNKHFNNKIIQSRSKFGGTLMSKDAIVKEIAKNKKEGVLSVYGLVSDQSPMVRHTRYWGAFFNQKVPVHIGAEMLAKRYDLNVVFLETKKIKRGYYRNRFSIITTDAKNTNEHQITDLYLTKLEQMIAAAPEHYFWSHNRFKHMNKG